MNKQLLLKLLQIAMNVLDWAEQECPKLVMSTQIGQDIAAAHSLVVKAWQKAKEL